MAGLMAQVPAWRLISIDPLPIIRSMEEEDLHVEGDSLASMVDEASDETDSSEAGLNEKSDERDFSRDAEPLGSW